MAVPVPDDVRDAVGRIMAAVSGAPIDKRGPGEPRWVRVDGLHVTLRFLGATPDVRVPGLAAAVAAAAQGVEPFRVEFAGAGAFPTPYRPRVLWLGIAVGAEPLQSLAQRVDSELQRLGWSPDDRPLRAHLTLARTDGVAGADEVARRLMESARDISLPWDANRLTLYKSSLGPGPARYESLATAELTGKG